jgi:hypothetical protein
MFANEQTAVAPRPPKTKSRLSNGRPSISARTATGRRIRDLAEAAAEQLGGWASLSALRQAQVRRFAELSALVEQRRHAALAGSPLAAAELVALENLVTKAGSALGVANAPPTRGG